MIRLLWNDDTGGTLTTEVMLVATVLVIGLIVGAKSYRDSAVTEWADYAQAIANLDQSYNIPDSTTASMAEGSGSGFVDARDFCDTSTDVDSLTFSSNAAFDAGDDEGDFDNEANGDLRFIRYGVPASAEE